LKKQMFLLFIALFAGITAAGVKHVAVIETEIDAQSGAAAEMTPAEVRLVTAELRREAVNNLPKDAYNVMTSETVYAQGGAVLEECADENCVITLGSKIGADYIVRGTISKMRTKFTLTVEIYETENGNLIALSDPVRSESVDGLIEMAAQACANMYQKFANSHISSPKPVDKLYALTVNANPTKGGAVSRNPNQKNYTPGTNVNVMATPARNYTFTGWTGDTTGTADLLTVKLNSDKVLTANFSRKVESKPKPEQPAQELKERRPMTGGTLGRGGFPKNEYFVQLGAVHSRPLTEKVVSLNMEGNFWIGEYYNGSHKKDVGFFGFNLPLTALLQVGYISFETGVHGDLLIGGDGGLFNAGLVVGAGLGFSKTHSRRYFYRYSGGYAFGTHTVGMWGLF
jgi:uncharacterized repeat protein (TIGR02543 family)